VDLLLGADGEYCPFRPRNISKSKYIVYYADMYIYIYTQHKNTTKSKLIEKYSRVLAEDVRKMSPHTILNISYIHVYGWNTILR